MEKLAPEVRPRTVAAKDLGELAQEVCPKIALAMDLGELSLEVRPRSLPATERVKVAQEVRPRSRLPATEGVKGAQEIRPRFVWGRRPRANGGRRRPRGRYGYFKYAPVISRGRFPAPAKPPVAAPRLDQFPLIPINTSPPTGNPAIDKELQRIAFAYGSIAQIRLMICARADLMMTWGVHRVETQTIWKKHDNLIKAVEALRENVFREYGIEAPPVPERFYLKF